VLDGVRAPGARTLARLSGEETARVRVVSAPGVVQNVVIDADVDPGALIASIPVSAAPAGPRTVTTPRRSTPSQPA
jgi:hypothetical protein